MVVEGVAVDDGEQGVVSGLAPQVGHAQDERGRAHRQQNSVLALGQGRVSDRIIAEGHGHGESLGEHGSGGGWGEGSLN